MNCEKLAAAAVQLYLYLDDFAAIILAIGTVFALGGVVGHYVSSRKKQ